MESIATLWSNLEELKKVLGEISPDLGTFLKLLGILKKEGLRDGFFRSLIDNRHLRRDFVAWANAQTEEADDQPLWEKVSSTSIRVFLNVPIPPPFKGAEPVVWNDDLPESVLVELREDGTYVDGKRVTLHLALGQKAKGGMKGRELRAQLRGKRALHPNIGYALYQNSHLIHESWKKDEQGRTRFIYFWAMGFRDSGGRLYVRCLCWDDGQWRWDYGWLAHQWGGQGPAALLAS